MRGALRRVAEATCLAIIVAAGQAIAADHALLIGVSDYPNLPKRLWLKGPGNDVALMSQTLQALGFEPARMHKLVSRTSREPTRHNILHAMQQLQADVRAGDHVLLYLAGHGSQQPQPTDHGNRPTEADGLDEVFLPADVDRWQGAAADQTIPNALLDDEIGEWMDAIVDRGATVWAIFDTCHAGGMARGRGVRTRAVQPAELGFSMARPALGKPTTKPAINPSIKPMRAPGRTDGRVLAFAARTHEATGEEWLPQGAPLGSNRMHGVFTFHVAQALKAMPHATASDLERAVRAAYARERRIAPTPEFKGDAAIVLR